jgi:hypothetical protein
MKKATWISIIAILCVFILAYVLRAQIYAELDALKIIPEPEHYTELYLNNSEALPKTIVAKQIVPFSFSLHNVMGQSEQYRYRVYGVLAQGKSIAIANGSVILNSGASTTITEVYLFPAKNIASSTPITIFISLPDFNQDLHFVLPSRE